MVPRPKPPFPIPSLGNPASVARARLFHIEGRSSAAVAAAISAANWGGNDALWSARAGVVHHTIGIEVLNAYRPTTKQVERGGAVVDHLDRNTRRDLSAQ